MAMTPAIAGLADILRGNADLCAFGTRGQHNHRLRARHAFDHANGPNQLLERRSIGGLDLEQHRVFASDVMALEHVVDQLDTLFKKRDRLGMGDRYANEGGYVLTQPLRIDGRVVTNDNSTIFKLFYALDYRRR